MMKPERSAALHDALVMAINSNDVLHLDAEACTALNTYLLALEDALKFYADPASYEEHAVGAPWDGCANEVDIWEDQGELAREALTGGSA